jgi:hypothetical protein
MKIIAELWSTGSPRLEKLTECKYRYVANTKIRL